MRLGFRKKVCGEGWGARGGVVRGGVRPRRNHATNGYGGTNYAKDATDGYGETTAEDEAGLGEERDLVQECWETVCYVGGRKKVSRGG